VTDYQRAELVCEACGTVVAERVIKEIGVGPHTEEGAVAYQPTGDSRILPQHPDSFSSRDSEGRQVNQDFLRKMRTTARMQNLTAAQRAILQFESRVRELAQQHGYEPNSAVTQRAIYMYHQVREKKLFSKPNITELALALLMTASREMKRMITWRDLLRGTGASRSKVTKYHYGIARSLGMEYREQSADSYIVYCASKIGRVHDGLLIETARRNAAGNDDANAAPNCVAAAALYIALRDSGEEWSQHDFCARVNLSEISLREWAARLGGHAKKEAPVRAPLNGDRVADGP